MPRYLALDHESRMKICRDFVGDLFDCEKTYGTPRCMTLEEAEYNLRFYAWDGVLDVPADLTAEMLCELWNRMVWDDLTAEG